MLWEVEITDEFEAWWQEQSKGVRYDVGAIVSLLEERGPQLPFPYSSGVNGSRHRHMRELRVQSGGCPIRIFYTFDARRAAILLVAGDKTGKKRFYEQHIPVADRLYDAHVAKLQSEEGKRNDR